MLYTSADRERRLPFDEPTSSSHWRSAFRRDYARLLHSPSFRRLQGKTQLFAGLESDFFRNRLTHSLEVAQIAKSIALKLNKETLQDPGMQLDPDLVEFAALAHDLGHPPFGHTGELELNALMSGYGGFEGNAQTLRLLTRLEKKLDAPEEQLEGGWGKWFQEGKEASFGLNLCARSLAAILKYDTEISETHKGDVKKGYYHSEADVVEWIRDKVLGEGDAGPLKTVECQIMDLADDIAYSTYDIEDSFKAGLLEPFDLLYPDHQVLESVRERVQEEIKRDIDLNSIQNILKDTFPQLSGPILSDQIDATRTLADWFTENLGYAVSMSAAFAKRAFFRTSITSALVDQAVRSVTVETDHGCPPVSAVKVEEGAQLRIAVLKNLVYVLLIESSRLRLVAHRGKHIIGEIFRSLATRDGISLLPRDFRNRYEQATTEAQQLRTVADFIAGMTDRYAAEFYARLRSEDFHTMFKP